MSSVKLARKQRFLKALTAALPQGSHDARAVIGDMNILEPCHIPQYRFSQPFEYALTVRLAVTAVEPLEVTEFTAPARAHSQDPAHALFLPSEQ
ncbi:hypothetical protein OHS33_34755 [Streptomyces sp. NBC_00536]|uniref:hypothetical protein n=1 Tax=Streptomyces sp. NBC_00536 TaxID=2975769 RepID=UPI002E80331F|nr:hypothetical protein [Streptomyces sp. NBC_00536]WUC83079.1 hypothetical protein OHS33_34755 [Streptomyces sp. NBC_00536]